MSYKETLNKGLKREFEFTIESSVLNKGVEDKVSELRKTIKMDGFRPGKVPNNIIIQKHGEAINAEVLSQLINQNVGKIIDEKKLRPVSQPKVDLKNEKDDKPDVDKLFTLSFEIFPEIKIADFSKIEIKSKKVKLGKAEIDKRMDLIASSNKTYKEQPDNYKSKNEDSVMLDYEGTIDGKNFDGGKAENQTIVIGNNRYLKDLEEGLVGVKKGDVKKVKVKFPADYSAKELQNADAVFECDIKKISSPQETKVDDAFAKSVGAKDLKDLRTKIEEQMSNEYSDLSKNMNKRELFEKLTAAHSFDLPEDLVETEFKNLQENYFNSQNPVSEEHKKEIKDRKLSTENEKKLKKDATERIHLGLILQEVGKVNEITVTPEEMNKALFDYASNFKGQEQKVIDYYRNNKEAAMQLQAPLYENKIVDFILSKVKLKEEEQDLDSFIKSYNNVKETKSPTKKKKTAKKKVAKKKAK